jgi:tetratricopeptide (TPR) repeat protein
MENLWRGAARAGPEKGLLRKRSPLAAPFRLMRFLSCLAAVLVVLASVPSVSAQVRVSEGTLSLPTYEEGPPDRNPPFDQIATSRFNYPYTLRTNVTDQRTLHNWRAIFLENEYLKCAVLPDLGGHLYTCIDKINGKPMFYANPSIKKANIGYRGAWAAFGVEYNFPVSHNWMSLSPIDYAFSQNSDGSASVTVGNIDRVYGMQWSVEMLLRPKSTVLEQRVSLSNRSDVRHRFYWWNNAGVEVWDDSHVEYPMRFAASHGFTEVQPWPLDSGGRDLSIIRNQTEGPVSLFVHGSREPFMGVWNPHTNSGTVHFANYDELPAKKIWSWGVDADGLDWRRALSDNNSAYVELQGGLFRNQETYAFLEPRQTIHFSEFWMPAREIGGITRANLAGVLSLKRDGSKLSAGFNSNQQVPGASVSVSDGTREIWSERADLVPEQTWSHALSIPDPTKKYSLEIKDESGNVLMRQTEGEYDWTPVPEIKVGPQQSYQLPLPESRTDDDWLRLGADQELNGKLLLALETYTNLLQKFPNSYQGLKAAGRLSATLLHYDAAISFLEQVRARDTTDVEAAYYLGVAYEGIGNEEEARHSFEAAYRLPRWKAAAALRLGELSARSGDLAKAEHYFAAATRLAPDDARAAEEFAAIERAHVDKGLALSLAQDSLRRFPLSYSLRDVLASSDAQHLANDHSRILNLAAEYMRLGLYASALDVLSRKFPEPLTDQSEPGTYASARDPMLAYYRGYCRSKLGQSPQSDYKQASTQPTDYVFPSSAEDLIVLRNAAEANPSDANAHYLLGTLYFSRGLTDEALAEWRRAKALNAKILVLDASMGIALLHVKHDPASALQAFRDGVSADRENDAVYLGADQSLSLLEKSSRERVQVFDAYPDLAKMPAPLVYELALNLAESGDFDRAVSLFHNRFFPREEGGTNVRQVWIEVQLQHALSSSQHGNCAAASSIANGLANPVSGLSFTNDGLHRFIRMPRTQYLLGKIYANCGNTELGRKEFESAAGKSAGGEIVWAWLAAKELPNFNRSEWIRRLQSALGPSQAMSETSSFAGWWIYNSGMLQRALGREDDAQREFRSALLLPDRMLSYHLTREALNSK